MQAQWHHMVSQNLVNIGSGNSLLPDNSHSTKQAIPEWMLTNHQGAAVAFTWGQFHKECSIHILVTSLEITYSRLQLYFSRVNELRFTQVRWQDTTWHQQISPQSHILTLLLLKLAYYEQSWLKTITAGALAPCVARPSTVMAFIV